MTTSGRDQRSARSPTSPGAPPDGATGPPTDENTTPPPGPAGGALGEAPRRPGAPRPCLTPGSLVGGRFVLIQEIGRGSTGTVFETRHGDLGHRVAIKVLHSHVVDNPSTVWRFKREAQLTASLEHPNIVSVFEVSRESDGVYFIVQEFLEGSSLRRLLQQQRRLDVDETLDYLVPIMGALVAAHHEGIVHRDVKPENIFLAQTEAGAVVPKLIDFGLAKIAGAESEFETQLGAVLGTPSYMSPEQALGRTVDARTDVWSLAVVMFEALAGERPFFADGGAAVMQRVREGEARPLALVAPHLPGRLAGIVHHALQRDLARRFPSMFDFLSAVVRFAEEGDPAFSRRHAASIPRALVTGAISPPVGPHRAARRDPLSDARPPGHAP